MQGLGYAGMQAVRGLLRPIALAERVRFGLLSGPYAGQVGDELLV